MAAKQTKIWQYYEALSSRRDVSIIDDPDFDKEYQPFLINRALSYHEDAVMAANLMNERASIDKKLQVLFLINTLRPRKRFSQWVKSSVSDDARTVAEYYGCSLRHARDLVSLHTSEQLAYMQSRLEKGGTTKKVSRNESP